jgi:hypothetical protein
MGAHGDPGAWPPQRPAAEDAPAEGPPPTDADVLAALRGTYTPAGWGILHVGGTWVAMNRPGPDIVQGNPAALRAAIDADSRSSRGPVVAAHQRTRAHGPL